MTYSPEERDLILRKLTQETPDLDLRCLHAASMVEMPPLPSGNRVWLLRTVSHTKATTAAETLDMILGQEELEALAHIVGKAMFMLMAGEAPPVYDSIPDVYTDMPTPDTDQVADVLQFRPKNTSPEEN